ncbi:MAG: hypothetical protein JJU22_03860 [Gammaproteobacteria bacterium]|nr:hypothetical protein [Gammaproteobacteria bacterium]
MAKPVGKGLQYDAALRRNNVWTQEKQVRPRKTIQRLIIGVHHERPNWSAHLNLWLGTDSVDPATVVQRLDKAG